MVNQQTSLTSSSFAMVGCWVGGSIFSHETETMILSYCNMLDKSNSHCYPCHRKHGPTPDTNTFNAAAFLIFIDILSIIH